MKLNKYLSKIPADKYTTNGKISIDTKCEIGQQLVLADKKRTLSARKSDHDSMNSDWQRMYANSDKNGLASSPMIDYHSGGNQHVNDTPSTSLVEYSMPEKNFIQGNLNRLNSNS